MVGILEDQFHETGVYFKTSKILLIFQVESMCQMWHPLPFEQSNQMVQRFRLKILNPNPDTYRIF